MAHLSLAISLRCLLELELAPAALPEELTPFLPPGTFLATNVRSLASCPVKARLVEAGVRDTAEPMFLLVRGAVPFTSWLLVIGFSDNLVGWDGICLLVEDASFRLYMILNEWFGT